jgi:hypothetical protein
VVTDRDSGAGLIIVVVDLIKLTRFTIFKIIKQHPIIGNPTNSALLREGANFRGTGTFIRSIQPTIIPQYLGLCGTTKIIKFPVTNSILTILILSTLHICTSYQLTVATHTMFQSTTISINVTLWRVGIAAPTIAVLACGAGDSVAGRVGITLSILAVEPYGAEDQVARTHFINVASSSHAVGLTMHGKVLHFTINQGTNHGDGVRNDDRIRAKNHQGSKRIEASIGHLIIIQGCRAHNLTHCYSYYVHEQ